MEYILSSTGEEEVKEADNMRTEEDYIPYNKKKGEVEVGE